MNNPMQIMRALQDPARLMPQLLKDSRIMGDPRARRAAEMMQQHDSSGLQQMAENLCREYGTTPQEVADQVRRQFRF